MERPRPGRAHSRHVVGMEGRTWGSWGEAPSLPGVQVRSQDRWLEWPCEQAARRAPPRMCEREWWPSSLASGGGGQHAEYPHSPLV